jgi:hypothetical protein
MLDVLNARLAQSTRTIHYTDSMHARREILDLDDFTAYNGVFDAQSKTLTVYSLDGTKAITFYRIHKEKNSFLEMSTCNILVYLDIFPSLIVALGETFNSGNPSHEPTLHSFCFAKNDEGTKVVLTS